MPANLKGEGNYYELNLVLGKDMGFISLETDVFCASQSEYSKKSGYIRFLYTFLAPSLFCDTLGQHVRTEGQSSHCDPRKLCLHCNGKSDCSISRQTCVYFNPAIMGNNSIEDAAAWASAIQAYQGCLGLCSGGYLTLKSILPHLHCCYYSQKPD